ncbi:GAF domain-containing protein, partial [Jatrophihabitans sp. YIM 134969]
MSAPDAVLAELATLARALAPAVAPAGHDDLLRSLTATARALFGAAACSLALLEPGSDDPDDDVTPDRLRYVAADGEGADTVRGMVIPATRGIAGWVVSSGQPVAVSDLRQDARFAADVAENTGYVPRAILAVPVTADGTPIGVLTLLDRDAGRETAAFDLQTASLFADQAALAITAARASADLAAVLLGALADAAGTGTPLAEAA